MDNFGFGAAGGISPADLARITTLENNEYKIIYWAPINSGAGTVTKPTNSTILLSEFPAGVDAVLETIVNGEPSGVSPVTAGGAIVTISSFDTAGNYTLSGTPTTAYPLALLYIIKIKAVDYVNVNLDYVFDEEVSNVALISNPLSQFAATTSAQLLGVISDKTGSGALVFADSPVLAGAPTTTLPAQTVINGQIAST